jgi:hypothetical protein
MQLVTEYRSFHDFRIHFRQNHALTNKLNARMRTLTPL